MLSFFQVFILISIVLESLALLPGQDIQIPTSYTFLKSSKYNSKLYTINAETVYDESVYLLDLHGSNSYSLGYDAGYLIGDMIEFNYNSLMVSLLGNDWYEPIIQELLNKFLDYQWDNYLSIEVPNEYILELNGLTAGGIAQGISKNNIGKITSRGIVLANFPGDISNIKLILIEEYNNPSVNQIDKDIADKVIEKLSKSWSGFTCSMYGVWGSRTENNRLFTGRNLDWLKSTGISMYKLVTVYHPSNGFSHATLGWAGLWGALTGISSQGITVHEANLESNDVTFSGFPWVLRLRYVMTYASTISSALSLWQNTNNTEGYNHGIGSANDNKAVVLETMASNTAIFYDNDSREAALGSPRSEAVYRTNHGYDDYTIYHYLWNDTTDYANSLKRYNAFPELFDSYESANKQITYIEAVNISAVLGSKGQNLYECNAPYTSGSNVLSVAFDPSNLIAYSAWENGLGDDLWTPAACNTYIKIDFNEWM